MRPKRCPKCCTSHGESLAAGAVFAALLGVVVTIGLRLAGADTSIEGANLALLIAISVLIAIVSTIGGQAYAMQRARARGWLE